MAKALTKDLGEFYKKFKQFGSSIRLTLDDAMGDLQTLVEAKPEKIKELYTKNEITKQVIEERLNELLEAHEKLVKNNRHSLKLLAKKADDSLKKYL